MGGLWFSGKCIMSFIHRLSVHSNRELTLPAIVTEIDEDNGTITVESGDTEYEVEVPDGFDFEDIYEGAAVVLSGSKGAGESPIVASSIEIGILRLQVIDPVTLNWNNAQDTFTINPADHITTDSFVAGIVVGQPFGGSGTLVVHLGDNEAEAFIGGGARGYARDYNTAGWPSHVSNLFTETQKSNSKVDFQSTYGITLDNLTSWITQDSFVGGIKYRDQIQGGLGRPNGNIIGYIYVPHIFYLSGAWRT